MSPPRLNQQRVAHLLGYRLARADVLPKQAFVEHVGRPFQLRPVEFTILQLVAGNPGITQKQLSQALALQPPHLTLLLDRMVERGSVARVRSETDRRAQHVHLTDDGRVLAEDSRHSSLAMEERVLARLSSGERALLFELLDKLAD